MDDIVIGPSQPPVAQLLVGARLVPATGIARAATLNKVSQSARQQQLTLAGDGTPVRLVYGQTRVGGRILNIVKKAGSSRVLVQALWGFQLDSIVSVTWNDDALPAGATATNYTGTQVAADSTLVAAFAAQGITYTDVLSGYAYSVFDLPASAFAGAVNATAVVKGRKVYDPRSGLTVWADNPALCLADFLTNTTYGAGKTVDWTTVGAAATWNDTALAGGEKHRLLNWALETVQAVPAVVEALRTYAGVWVINRGGTLYLVQDKVRSSDATYAHASGQIASWGAWAKRDLGDQPTIVEVRWTDTSTVPYREKTARAPSGALPGGTPVRISSVSLPGITRYSQAFREAVERLNKLSTSDLTGEITVFDAGMAHEAGDVVTITLPFGITSKLMRLTAPPENAGPGMWRLQLAEYDPAAYSTEVATEPTYGDTDLDDPNAPPAPASVSAVEELYQLENGIYASRARITITAPTFQWIAGYRIEVLAAGSLIDTGSTASTEYATPALQEGVAYTIRAYTLSSTGAAGEDYASTSLAPAGKSLPPGNVATLSGFEVAGDVYLNWTAAVDLDIWRYEIRYGGTAVAWDDTTLLDRVDGLRAVIRGTVPAGEWKFQIKAVDSVGQYSATAATLTLTVTLDPDALQTEHAFSAPTLTNMSAFQRVRGGPALWVTDPDAAGDKFGTLFSSALGTYTDELAAYHTSATSTWLSESHDFGQPVTGDWNVSGIWSTLSGSVTVTLQLSGDGSSWTDYTSLPTKQAARYARVKLEALTTSTLLVESVAVTAAAVTRKEFGTITCAATGTDTVTLDQVYSARRRIVLTPIETTAARIAVADNITFGDPSSFDVYLFNDSGTRVAGDVAWAWEGI